MLPRVGRPGLALAVSGFARKPSLDALVRVVFAPERDTAALAWAEWRKTTDINRIDGNVLKLLPEALVALERHGIRDPEHKKLAGMVRFMFVRSEKTREAARLAAAALVKHGIRPCAIKGLALAASYGTTLGRRPMLDADLVVEDEFDESLKILKDHRFVAVRSTPNTATLKRLDWLRNDEPGEVDLHVRALELDPCFWSFRWDEPSPEPYRVLDPAGMLIVGILHGLRHDGGSLWMKDIVSILASRPAVDWERFTAYAREKRLSLALELGTRELPDEVLPREVRVDLFACTASVVEALELRHHVTENDRSGAEAAKVMRELRAEGERTITERDIEERAGRIRWDRRWLTEWQTSAS